MLSQIHETFAWFVIVSNGLVGCWAIAADRLAVLRTPWLWRAVAVAQVSIFVQATLGVIIFAGQGIEVSSFHMFYGFLCIIGVGILYAYRQQLSHYLYLLYGFGSLFIMGLALRAVVV